MTELLLKKGTRLCLVVLTVILLSTVILPESVFAGKGTFRKTGPDKGVFDFCVSVRFNATPTQLDRIRQVFEVASQILADVTDGQHQFGNISIINNSGASDQAEFWINENVLGSRAHANSWYGFRGSHANLFYGSQFAQPNTYWDGLVIVHEFAHMAYNVKDEYYSTLLNNVETPAHCVVAPDVTSPTLSYCIMDDYNLGSRRSSNNYSVNEFCVDSNHDKPDAQGLGENDTAQSRQHNNESCWETMSHLERQWRLNLPNGLPQDAPPPTTPVTYGSTCAAQTQRVVILIDRSGSMTTDNRLTFAKQAVNLFSSEFGVGDYMGVVSFSTTASVNFPLTQINDDTARNNAKASVNSLVAAGATNIGEGLLTALAQINSQGNCTGCEKTIILLSDGDHNAGLPPEAVIADLQKAGVNVVAATVGANISVPGETSLKNIANQTQGRYFRAAKARDFLELLVHLAHGFGGYKAVADATQIINSGQVKEIPVRVEAGAANTNFGVIAADQMDNLTLSLRKPSGGLLTETNSTNVEFKADPNMRLFKVAAPEAGIWTIVVSAGAIRTGDINVFSNTKHDGTDLLARIDRDTVFSTESVKVEAIPMYEGRSIVGSSVTGTVTRPDGSQLPITLFDDGSTASGDLIGEDGVYTALFSNYNNDGTYTFNLKYENTTGKIYAGEPMPDENGVVPVAPQATVPASVRLASATAIVSGLTTGDNIWFDDALPRGATLHGDWYWVDANPAPIMGGASHQSKLVKYSEPYEGMIGEHSFDGAFAKLPVNPGDKLFTYVFLDADNMPGELMLQWSDGDGWEHRAYWGSNNIAYGVEGTNSRRYMGPLPVSSQWVRLEVPASQVGLEGKSLSGMSFIVDGGRATWDRSGKVREQPPTQSMMAADFVWVEDAIPAGAIPAAQDDHWDWVSSSPSPVSGQLNHRSFLADHTASGRFRSHSFSDATDPMPVDAGDVLFTYAYLDPTYTPDEIMLQWNDGDGWEHRAYWGANFVDLGTTGTESRRFMGGLPPAGRWVRLEVPASYVGLEGKKVSGMSFGYYKQNDRARVSWDQAGKSLRTYSVPLPLSAITPFYRFFGTNFGGYYYYSTNDIGRADQAVQRIQFYIFPNQAAGTVPFYRFRNNGKRYFYSTDRNGPAPSVWTYEAIAGYVYPNASTPGTVPLYIFRGSYDYFFTTNYSEGAGMGYEGIACYVNESSLHVPTAPSQLTWLKKFLTWKDNSTNETVFKIERADPDSGRWVLVDTVGADVTLYAPVTGLDTNYNYAVRAANATGNSKYSNVTCPYGYHCTNLQAENTPPEVYITNPVNNGVVGSKITIRAEAFDDEGSGTISKVEFFDGSTKLGETTLAPYNFYWDNATAGTHTLTARATDMAEATTASPPVSVVVNNQPAASITGPTDGTVFNTPASITLNVNASDTDGTINKVEFFQGETKLGEDSAAPYTLTWENAAAGSYNLTAIATDNNGLSVTSPVINISVNNSPTVSITAPANNTTLTFPASINISADAADADGTISKVEFFQGQTKLGEATSSPYSMVWSPTTTGTFSLTAKATDNSNAKTTSSPVNITLPGNDDYVWVDDRVPTGGIENGTSETWNWVANTPAPRSGTLSHQSNIVPGFHNHYFTSATQKMAVEPGDKLFAYVYIDPLYVPSEIMVQWHDGTSWHNAYWGADNLNWVGTRFRVGDVPAAGQWVRLEVPASAVGMEGKIASGMAFDMWDGRATWDRAGKTSNSVVWVEDRVPTGGVEYATNEGWSWVATSPMALSGATAHQSAGVAGFHNHYFISATETLEVNSGDTLFAYVYLDAANPPTEIMMQWHDGTSWHNAYWGADNLNWVGTRFRVGDVPAAGQWVRLEVPASAVGMEGKTASGMAFDMWDGRATWDRAGKYNSTIEELYVEDDLPTGAVPNGTSETWNWVANTPAPRSGALSHQSNIVPGFHNHYFTSATQKMAVEPGDKLFAYVYIDPLYVPSEIMVQWHDGTSWHNAYWGADNLNWVGTRFRVGDVPAAGQWVRLEVAASLVGMEGKTASGMAFDMWDGRATWDRAGKMSNSVVWVEDRVPTGGVEYATNEGWSWVATSPTALSGSTAHQSAGVAGFHNHYFISATEKLTVGVGDKLFAWVYIDPNSPPSELMVQWHDGTSWHNAYWGADNLNWVGTRFRVGDVPAAGQWVRLEVPASAVGMEGKTASGMAFDMWDGRATWDRAGKTAP